MTDNPYSSPRARVGTWDDSSAVSRAAIAELEGTRPWVRMFAVLGFVLGILGLASGLYLLFTLPVIGILQGLFSLVYVIPSLRLWHYSKAIGQLSESSEPTDLREALAQQHRFWRFVGIATIALLIVYLVALGLLAAGVISIPSGLIPTRG